VWLDNAARLGIDLATIEAAFLSHWHWDHSGGLPATVEAIASARRAAGLAAPAVDVHPDRPDQRGILEPTGVVAMLPDEPTFEVIADVGGRVEVHDEPHLLADGRVLGSGRSRAGRPPRPDSSVTAPGTATRWCPIPSSWTSGSSPPRCAAAA
jgi:7,8-dihydropterin-6-yl-methyl-4-(beta-D-ribofuranosyl)aminobenzene 5'-phosphate synthase